jgi:hypothetical protein
MPEHPQVNPTIVLVPCPRGYGTTRFLSDATFRNGQQLVRGVTPWRLRMLLASSAESVDSSRAGS